MYTTVFRQCMRVVFVSFGTLDTNTRVTYSGEEESTARRWNYEGVPVEQGAVLVDVVRFGAQHIPGVRLPREPLTELAKNQEEGAF